MKRKSKFLLASCGVLVLFMVFFLWIEQQYAAPTPVPSVPGGYYEDPFTLTFSVPKGGKVYYTTDGSTPTVDSMLYVDGIEIWDRTQEPNVYNSIPNLVRDWENHDSDETPVPKGTVIRAVFINHWGISSEIITQTYFVGLQPPTSGYTLSLVFNPDTLFGDAGIYVTGIDYDTWYQNGQNGEEPVPNFIQDLEATVTMDLLSGSDHLHTQPIGLRIQGASAREDEKKRFVLVAREEYSGQNVFETDVFPNTQSHSIMTKREFVDAMAADLVGDRATAVQHSVPVQIFLNGEFWYDGFMLERFDRQYFLSHYNVEDRVLYKNGALDDNSRKKLKHNVYSDFYDWINNTDFSDPQNWNELQKRADIQSFIDFIAINYFLCNPDFTDWHNYVVWRSLTYGPSQYEDLRWRWCTFDIDFICYLEPPEGLTLAEINTFANESSSYFDKNSLYRAVRSNPEFRRQFVLSFMDILNNNFAPERVSPILEKYGHSLDWRDGYFRERPKYAVQHLAEEFDLTGTLETVSVSTSTPEMGSVTINTSTIDLSDRSWSGQYFTDYPITITAVPNPGYRFVGWQGSVQDTSGSLTLPVDGGLMLEAVFAPI